MDFEHWLVFVGVWILAGLPLGPNALNCIAVAASAGFARALWPIAGILLASLAHMTATVLGVAAVLAANAAVFQVLKLVGAAYLIWMGVSLWRRGAVEFNTGHTPSTGAIRLLRNGFLISMTNPKAVFVYLAVFSQFLTASAPLGPQLLVLVPTATLITLLIYLGYALTGMGVGRLLASAKRRLVFSRSIASLYILAGLGLAVSGSSETTANAR